MIIFLYVLLLLIAAVRDWKIQKIDDRISICIVMLAIADQCISSGFPISERIGGALAVSVPMLLLSIVLPGAFGGGDIKMIAASGLMLGTRLVVRAMIIAVFAAGIFAMTALMMGRLSRKDRFAFGPFLALGLSIVSIFLK